MATKPTEVSKSAASPTPPSNRPHGKLEDLREHFVQISAKQTPDIAFRNAFIQNKILVAHTHPTFDLAARDRAVASLTERIGPDAQKALAHFGLSGAHPTTPPVPGGVGYGMFYTAPFKAGWGHGTSFACDFVCPTPPGGNVTTFLYLTATNRSGKGVEAFVSYNGQGNTHFRVFDWSRPDPWQTDCPFSALGNYLRTESAHGHPYQVLPVWNSTWLLNGSTWRQSGAAL